MSRSKGHETRDLPPGVVVGAIGGLLGLVVLAGLVAWAISAGFRSREPVVRASPFDQAAAVSAEPRLAVNPRADRLDLEAQAKRRLTGYGWTDRQAGLARIPIDRAMALLAARGWPDADAGVSSTPAQQSPAERRP